MQWTVGLVLSSTTLVRDCIFSPGIEWMNEWMKVYFLLSGNNLKMRKIDEYKYRRVQINKNVLVVKCFQLKLKFKVLLLAGKSQFGFKELSCIANLAYYN